MATLPHSSEGAKLRRASIQGGDGTPGADASHAATGTNCAPFRRKTCFSFPRRSTTRVWCGTADPKARGACWSAIGAACLAVALLTGVAFPNVASTVAGYQLEHLRGEERRLIDERRNLELQEAELLSPERLEKLARNQNLVTPQSGQVVHLDADKPDSSVAMVKQ